MHACSVMFGSVHPTACQAPMTMRFSQEEYWSGLPCPPPGECPNSRIKPKSPVLQADSLPLSL